MSTSTLPAFDPARAPCDPSITSRTSLGKPTIAKTTSEASATALGEAAHFAPFANSGSAFSLRRLKTVAANPAFIRWPTMLAPITPVPIHPTRVFPGAIVGRLMEGSVVHFREERQKAVECRKYI